MSIFTDTFQFSDSIDGSLEGFTLTARIEPDTDMGAPWVEHDGHGPVSEWTTRDKLPGERIINEDGNSRRYYDFKAAIKQAKAEGWDAPPYGKGTKGEQAERAVNADFRFLKAWCDDEWQWVGVIVTASKNGIELGNASLWGIESESRDYLLEVAEDLASEAVSEAKATLGGLCGATQ